MSEHLVQVCIQRWPVLARGQHVSGQFPGQNVEPDGQVIVADRGKPPAAQPHRVGSARLIEMTRHHRPVQRRLGPRPAVRRAQLDEVRVGEVRQVGVPAPRALLARVTAMF
ncbi:hypothetical protein BKA01_003018 [Pseudonocardia eucalypti]|nr:hypothetical protein [Pseudonocardia eucalypti]